MEEFVRNKVTIKTKGPIEYLAEKVNGDIIITLLPNPTMKNLSDSRVTTLNSNMTLDFYISQLKEPITDGLPAEPGTPPEPEIDPEDPEQPEQPEEPGEEPEPPPYNPAVEEYQPAPKPVDEDGNEIIIIEDGPTIIPEPEPEEETPTIEEEDK